MTENIFNENNYPEEKTIVEIENISSENIESAKEILGGRVEEILKNDLTDYDCSKLHNNLIELVDHLREPQPRKEERGYQLKDKLRLAALAAPVIVTLACKLASPELIDQKNVTAPKQENPQIIEPAQKIDPLPQTNIEPPREQITNLDLDNQAEIHRSVSLSTSMRNMILNVLPPYDNIYTQPPFRGENGKYYWWIDEWLRIDPKFWPEISKQHSRENYLNVISFLNVDDEKNRRYTATNEFTFCNIFVSDATEIMGVPIPRWINGEKTNTNYIYDWLGDGYRGGLLGWKNYNAKNAQELANQGFPVVAISNGEVGSAHMSMVIPGPGETVDGVFYPTSAQAGRINFVGESTYKGFNVEVNKNIKINYFANTGSGYSFISPDGRSVENLNNDNIIAIEQFHSLGQTFLSSEEFGDSSRKIIEHSAELLNNFFASTSLSLNDQQIHFSYNDVMLNFEGMDINESNGLTGGGSCYLATLLNRAVNDFNSKLELQWQEVDGFQNNNLDKRGYVKHEFYSNGLFTIKKLDHEPFIGIPGDMIVVSSLGRDDAWYKNYEIELRSTLPNGGNIPEDLEFKFVVERLNNGDFMAEIVSNYTLEELQKIIRQ